MRLKNFQMQLARFPFTWISAAAVLGFLIAWGLCPAAPVAQKRLYLREILAGIEDRGELIRYLKTWTGRVASRDRDAIHEFQRKNDGKDWVLYLLAGRFLETIAQEPSEADLHRRQAEDILLRIEPGAYPEDFYDWTALELAPLAGDAPNIFKDILRFRSEADAFRRRVATKVLAIGRSGGAEAALRTAVEAEPDPALAREMLLALLSLDSSESSIDFAVKILTRTAPKPLDQFSSVLAISHSPLPAGTRKRLLLRMERFDQGGQRAALRGLAWIGDSDCRGRIRELLAQGSPALLAEAAAIFSAPGDPNANEIVIQAWKSHPELLPAIMIPFAVERDSRQAAAWLREWKTTSPTLELLLAGALAKWDESSAPGASSAASTPAAASYRNKIIQSLDDPARAAAAWMALGWQADEDSARAAAMQLAQRDASNSQFPQPSVYETLGRMGSGSALAALREALRDRPSLEFASIGGAIREVGLRRNDSRIRDEGQEILCVASVLESLETAAALRAQTAPSPRSGGKAAAPGTSDQAKAPPNHPQAQREELERARAQVVLETAARWLREHPAALDKIISRIDSNWGVNSEAILALLDRAWSERAQSLLEAESQSNTLRAWAKGDSPEGRPVLRERLGAFLESQKSSTPPAP